MEKSITEFTFSPELMQFIASWKQKSGNLIMILHRVQETYGYIPKEAISLLAKILNISEARIYGVVTFYHFFKLEKPGRYVISICTGTACYLKGAGQLLEELKRLLNIDIGQITADGKFSLEEVRCIGCCGLAPVISINGEIFGRLEPRQLEGILDKFV